jgi:hypothetical protein
MDQQDKKPLIFGFRLRQNDFADQSKVIGGQSLHVLLN